MEEIISKDNKWVKEFNKLALSKSYRDEKNLFSIEGVKLVLEAFENNVSFEMVFVTQMCFNSNSIALEKLFQSSKTVIVSDMVSKKLSFKSTPQGIYAICNKPTICLNQELIYKKGNYLMLVNLQDSGNVGTILRTADALGVSGVIVTKNTCDLYNPKVLSSAMGATFRIKTLIVDDENDFLKELNLHEVKTYASVLDKLASVIGDTPFLKPSVLLIGNEGNGLEEETVKLCSNKITIKMQGRAESLNASMAAGILIWEMMK